MDFKCLQNEPVLINTGWLASDMHPAGFNMKSKKVRLHVKTSLAHLSMSHWLKGLGSSLSLSQGLAMIPEKTLSSVGTNFPSCFKMGKILKFRAVSRC